MSAPCGRVLQGKSALDDISETCLEECAQLVKVRGACMRMLRVAADALTVKRRTLASLPGQENSIEGSKKKSVAVVSVASHRQYQWHCHIAHALTLDCYC